MAQQQEGANKGTRVRLFLAFLLAPVLPCFLWTFDPEFIKRSVLFFVSNLIVSWVLIIVFAAPLYFVLKSYNLLRPLYVIPFAILISLIPELILEITSIPWGGPEDSTYSFYGQGCQIIENNVRTSCGYIVLFKRILWTIAYGALAGTIFCMVYFGSFSRRS